MASFQITDTLLKHIIEGSKQRMAKILEVKNLVKTFADIRAVDDISFSVEQGICLGLLGPNGAGKTTAIEICEGVIPATSGEIAFPGAEGWGAKALTSCRAGSVELLRVHNLNDSGPGSLRAAIDAANNDLCWT